MNTEQVLVQSSASLYTPVYKMRQTLRSIQRYKLMTSNRTDINLSPFSITPQDGIVYLSNDSLWKVFNTSNLELDVYIETVNEVQPLSRLMLQLHVERVKSTSYADDCKSSCSLNQYEDTCISSCGLGTPGGRCTWHRQSNSTLPLHYETCSPTLHFCPDRRCDELEHMVPGLCPQDCTERPIIGHGHLNDRYNPPRGIGVATGPCWCNSEQQCYCMSDVTTISSKVLWRLVSTKEDMSRVTLMPSESRIQLTERCGATCQYIIYFIIGMLLISTVVIVALCWCTRRMRLARDKRTSSATSSQTVVVSNYRSTPVDYYSVDYDTIRRQIRMKLQFDSKWEFPRTKLFLEQALGEGEFGQVVRARALDIQGTPGYTVVAVKMLKECASNAEFRDLIFEYNLLKDVRHTNVIRLLGVCTTDGPFYLIVEYCQHGSLRSFLRCIKVQRERQEQRDSAYYSSSGINRVSDVSTVEDSSEMLVVTAKDLLSFSWQIAKGMAYLSEMISYIGTWPPGTS